MNDFSYLSKLNVSTGSTSEYTMFEITGEPVIILGPATEVNKPYFNAFLKRTRRSLAKGNDITPETMARNRDDDRALYPQFVMKGWRNVVDSEGKPVPFSVEAATEFVKQLPDWLFDGMRNHATSPRNFFHGVDVEELQGN